MRPAPLQIVEPIPARVTGLISVNLEAVAHNYRTMKMKTHGMAHMAPVLKANAYGLGTEKVALRLMQEGCTAFFTANLDEAYEIRALSSTVEIFVLGGVMPGTEWDYLSRNLIPVLISPRQIERWIALQHQENTLLPAVLHLDTGMSRTGISAGDFPKIKPYIPQLKLRFVMSHYANSERPESPENYTQLEALRSYMPFFPTILVSLANSHGLLLPKEYHGHWVRPGIAMGGMCSTIPGLEPAFAAYGRVVQLKSVPSCQAIGYNGTYVTSEPRRVATVGIGYADGLKRLTSNRGALKYQGFVLPILGLVSMDFVVVDVTHVPENRLHEGDWLTLFDDAASAESLASASATTVYELMVGLNGRFNRQYY